ncbi:hypothetical protein GCM10010274_15150 [Streptomyces lavendofoliae]|uniref:Uncharacterized protein n=1 Tax=Streptomyces lavendofoliae TaxID=67314 RepID=A0A918HUK8_9ACTN|nr:hypothetical protein GCM10010274_15150 [Streptomyces lavendofoliae]
MRAVGRLDGGAGLGIGVRGGIGMRGHAAQGKDVLMGAGMAILYAGRRGGRQGVGREPSEEVLTASCRSDSILS